MIDSRHVPSLYGKYICIEGPDGVGKTTIANALEAMLRPLSDNEVLRVREPGGTTLGEQIRQLLMTSNLSTPQTVETQYHLFAAARADVHAHLIDPARRHGAIVIADRGVMSSYVYQYAHATPDHLRAYRPDILILLTANDAVIEDRLRARAETLSQFDDSYDKRQTFRNRYRLSVENPAFSHALIVPTDGQIQTALEDVCTAIVHSLSVA